MAQPPVRKNLKPPRDPNAAFVQINPVGHRLWHVAYWSCRSCRDGNVYDTVTTRWYCEAAVRGLTCRIPLKDRLCVMCKSPKKPDEKEED